MSLTKNQNKTLFIFLGIWLLAGMLQTYFMDLSGEEAYYFLFSQYLDWGYMDHPPMVAFFTRMGYELFPNNLGARLMMTVLNTLSLWLVYETVKKKDVWLFIYLVIALIPVHAGSFLIKTDVPLIFFEALFFYLYREYLENDNWKNVVLLAFTIAAMLLSKYHGVLILFFVILSNWELLKKKSFWRVILGVIILMLPHTYWQYMHDWTSIKFHLQGRADLGFSWKNVINYVWSQPVVLGPLLGFILIPASFIYKPQNQFERALKLTLVGVLVFFFINSFRVYIHKHWTSVVAFPMMILGYEYLYDKIKIRKIVKVLSLISLGVFLLLRAYLSYDFIPNSIDEKLEALHGWKSWANELDSLANGRDIVFINSYENAARYTYLTQNDAHCLSTYYFNNTHYDIWQAEDTLQGKDIILINNRTEGIYEPHRTAIGEKIRYKYVDNYRSYSKVKIDFLDELSTFKTKSKVSLSIQITNNHSYHVTSADGLELPPQLGYYFLKNGRRYSKGISIPNIELKSGETKKMTIDIETPEEVGSYELRLGIQAGWIPATINSKRMKIKVVN